MAIGRVHAMIVIDAGTPNYTVVLNRGASAVNRLGAGFYEIILSQGITEKDCTSSLCLRQGDMTAAALKCWVEHHPVEPTIKRVHTLVGDVETDLDFDLTILSVL